jgi:peptidoglycan/LPS O-acetylase OafA/YrhL
MALYIPALWVSRDAVKIAEFKVALPWLLGFMQEFRPASAGNVFGHAWTLGIEEKFYLFWPLLVVVLYPFRRRSVAILFALAIAALSLPHVFARSYGGLLIGAILGVALSQSSNWLSRRTLPRVPDWLVVLGVVAMYGLTLYSEKLVLLFSGSIALLIASLALRDGWMRNALSNRALVFIGKRSYAMYLIHVLAINAVEKILPRFSAPTWLTVVGLSYGASLLGACILQAAVERPCMAFGRELSASFSGARSLNEIRKNRDLVPILPCEDMDGRAVATSE